MSEDEIIMYIVARSDLAMSHGKFGAQCGHGVQLAIRKAESLEDRIPDLKEWEGKDYVKITLRVKSQDALVRLGEQLTEAGVPNCIVKDNGRTEIAAGSLTVLATVPMRKSLLMKTPLKRLQAY